MVEKLLGALVALTQRRGRAIAAAFALLTVAGGILAWGVPVSTSQRALVPPDHPVQRDYQAYVEEFGAADELIVVLEGDPARLGPAADRVAAALRSEKSYVRSVFYKVDLGFFRDRAPYFAPLDVLRQAEQGLARAAPLLQSASQARDLDGLLAAADGAFEGAAGLGPDEAQAALRGLDYLLGEWRAFLQDPARTALEPPEELLASAGPAASMLRTGGTLRSHDGRLLFLFVKPTSIDDDVKHLRPFLGAMRSAVERARAEHPAELGEVRVAFTGMPAHELTQAETVFSDVGNGAIVSAILVLIIVALGFRTLRKMALAVLPLVAGMLISVAVVRLVLGRLNLVSAAFLAVMFGMSIDFGIYLVRRAEEELGQGADLARALRTSLTQTGRGVLAGGLTTAAAFFAITLSEFAGFSELGITAGIGTIVCLLSVFLLVPSLAFLFGLEPRKADLAKVSQVASGPRVRRLMIGVVAATAVLALASGLAYTRIHFDYDALRMLPRDTESTAYQLRMQEESDFQASAAIVVADSLEQVRAIAERLRARAEIARVESLADLIPPAQQEKAEALTRLRPRLAGLSLTYEPSGAPVSRLRERLDGFAEKLAEAQEAAFSGGRADLVERIGKSLALAEALSAELGRSEAAAARTAAFEKALFTAAGEVLAAVKSWLDAPPVTEGDLPPEMRERFRSKAGRYSAYVFPRESIWDVDALDRFLAMLRKEAPLVTGFPATHQVHSRLMVRGFMQAMAYALLAVVAILFVGLRRPRSVALALVPLAVSGALLQLLLWALGVSYNYAAIAGFPVVIGYGVAYGVNIVQRWSEDPTQTALVASYTTGKGVLLSAATTAAGLVSIAFARHAGVAAFGLVMLGGIVASLLAAVIVLPSIIDLVYLHRRKSHAPAPRDAPPA